MVCLRLFLANFLDPFVDCLLQCSLQAFLILKQGTLRRATTDSVDYGRRNFKIWYGKVYCDRYYSDAFHCSNTLWKDSLTLKWTDYIWRKPFARDRSSGRTDVRKILQQQNFQVHWPFVYCEMCPRYRYLASLHDFEIKKCGCILFCEFLCQCELFHKVRWKKA